MKKLVFSSVAITDDPIELHILDYLDKILNQNLRLRAYVHKSGVWADLKEISKWKPYDFYHYFCNLYENKYKKAYRLQGNIVRAYQKIEIFVKKNKIPNEEYREFIERAFARYFSNYNMPVIASICSSTLYNHLMLRNTKSANRQDWNDLNMLIEEEGEEFDKEMNLDNHIYLDKLIEEESKAFI